jgi:hypothetical protein
VSAVAANSNFTSLSYFLGQCKMSTRCHVRTLPDRWYKKMAEKSIIGVDNSNRTSNVKRMITRRGLFLKRCAAVSPTIISRYMWPFAVL